MSDAKRTQQLQDLEQQWRMLNEQLTAMQNDYNLTTVVERRFELAPKISQKTAEREQIAQAIHALETADKLEQLRHQLLNEERNGSYGQALDTAEKIRAQFPQEQRIEQKIAKLRERQAFYQPAMEALGQISIYMAELGMALYQKIVYALHPKNKRDDLIRLLLPTTQQFLRGEMTAEQFRQVGSTLLADIDSKPTTGLPFDYAGLCEKILSGHTVLFFGTEMAGLYGAGAGGVDEQTLAQQLADAMGYPNFRGNLSTIAELYQLRQGGRKTLLDNLHQSLPQDAQRLLLYRSLAQAPQHLILVTSVYDCLLEAAFKQANKPFVELSSIINCTQHYDIGHVVLNYSDNDKDEIVYPQEQLSTLKLLDNHSILYKMRGTSVDTQGKQLSARKDALTLSESNYLTFAENARKIIPNFLAEHLREREILFIGFTPRSWEDRLLVRTLLSHRYNSDFLCLRLGDSVDPLEAAFWKKQNVDACDIDFETLDNYLQGALP